MGGAKAAVRAASMSRPTLSAAAISAGKAPALRPETVSPDSVAVPEPERPATIASRDLPVAESEAVRLPLPARPASAKRGFQIDAFELQLGREKPGAAGVLQLEEAAQRAAVELALQVGEAQALAVSRAFMRTSLAAVTAPAESVAAVTSRSAVNGVETPLTEGTRGQPPSALSSAPSPSDHARPAAKFELVERQVAGEMRHAVLQGELDVAADRTLLDRALEAGKQSTPSR